MKERMPELRSLPRIFLPGADMSAPFELPKSEYEKLHKVLRMKSGDPFALLPDDGSLWVCSLEGRSGVPHEHIWPNTEPEIEMILIQALPKVDRLETMLRMGVEIGVSRFLIFPSERSVVRWEPGKLETKLVRLEAIIREAAEQCFRSRLPKLETVAGLAEAIQKFPEAIVLSEREDVVTSLWEEATARLSKGDKSISLMIGPEGGWAPRELAAIGDRGVTLGPLVLRTDTAGPAAAAVILFGAYAASRKNSLST